MPALKLAVGIATVGRRELLSETLRQIAGQTRLPERVFLSPVSLEDYDPECLSDLPFEVEIVRTARGLCSQRNAILRRVEDFDVLVFFDDDFFPGVNYLQEMEQCFSAHADIVVAHGEIVADGAKSAGIDSADARHLLATQAAAVRSQPIKDTFDAYGCNMCLRVSVVVENRLVFDEEMPLYGWMEDLDFCRRILAYGRVVKNPCAIGVHLGTKSGRISGVKYGYSQVANPIYIWRKGLIPRFTAIRWLAKNTLLNVARALWPEPWIDRGGRAKGNCLALMDWVKGRMHPRRILDLT